MDPQAKHALMEQRVWCGRTPWAHEAVICLPKRVRMYVLACEQGSVKRVCVTHLSQSVVQYRRLVMLLQELITTTTLQPWLHNGHLVH